MRIGIFPYSCASIPMFSFDARVFRKGRRAAGVKSWKAITSGRGIGTIHLQPCCFSVSPKRKHAAGISAALARDRLTLKGEIHPADFQAGAGIGNKGHGESGASCAPVRLRTGWHDRSTTGNEGHQWHPAERAGAQARKPPAMEAKVCLLHVCLTNGRDSCAGQSRNGRMWVPDPQTLPIFRLSSSWVCDLGYAAARNRRGIAVAPDKGCHRMAEPLDDRRRPQRRQERFDGRVR